MSTINDNGQHMVYHFESTAHTYARMQQDGVECVGERVEGGGSSVDGEVVVKEAPVKVSTA